MRESEYKINELILNRWSAKAMSGEELSDNELMTLFEAAKWAPSSYNNQHWRFIYAKRGTTYWDKFFDLLFESNQNWVKNASVLILMISRKNYEHNEKPIRTRSFDAGSAWENLALQAISMNLVVHPIGGFDLNRAKEVANVSDDYEVEIMIAIGKKGKKEDLPKEMQEREVMSDRKPLNEIVFEGNFNER
tara:strand:- start:1016 stop:1588 length:573 start_codon:yes stop_codon:yes gene_type:complete